MIRVILCGLLALLLPLSAYAENCFVINVDTLDMNRLLDQDYIAAHLSAQTEGLRIIKYISDSNELAARVRLTITQTETANVIFDKNYGYVSGTFDSGDLYLPFVDNNTIPYLVTLNIENWTYALPFMHMQPRLTGNCACTVGVRLRDYNPALTENWMMGTMLNLDQLRASGYLSLPLCASNLYIVGTSSLTMNDNLLSVSLSFAPDANVNVRSGAVYLIGDVSGIQSGNPEQMTQTAYTVGQAISTEGLTTALFYIPLTLDYDPSSLEEFTYDPNSSDALTQLSLWQDNLLSRAVCVTVTDDATAPDDVTVTDGVTAPDSVTVTDGVAAPDSVTVTDGVMIPDNATVATGVIAPDDGTVIGSVTVTQAAPTDTETAATLAPDPS